MRGLDKKLKFRLADVIQEVFPDLPPRLSETAVMICMGYTTQKISQELGLKYKTAATYVHFACRKTGSLHKAELVSKVLAYVLQKSA